MQTIHVQEPWLTYINSGSIVDGTRRMKTVEGRRGGPDKFTGLVGSPVIFKSEIQEVRAVIVGVRYYRTLDEYLTVEWKKAAPQARSFEEAKDLYLKIEGKEKEKIFSPESILRIGGINALELLVF